MSARLVAEIAALSRLADFLGKQLLKEAGDAGELRAEVEALKKPAGAPAISFTGGCSGQTLNPSFTDDLSALLQGQRQNSNTNNLDLLNQGSDWNKDS